MLLERTLVLLEKPTDLRHWVLYKFLGKHTTMTNTLHADSDSSSPEGEVVLGVLGDHPKTRILLALLTDPDRDYNLTDIGRLSDTDRSTVHRHMDSLLEYGVVKKTRKAGNAWMYQINRENEAAKAFAKFEWEAIKALGESREE